MEKKVEIMAYHGWGFDPDFWKPIQEVIPESIPFKSADRGYFGTPNHPRFDADTKVRVVFTHSFGLQWANTAVLSKADYLVIFNGFDSFFPESDRLNAISKKGLESMIRNFEDAPKKVLDSFYAQCFNVDEAVISIPEDINQELLFSDLKELRNTRFPLIDLDFGAVFVALESKKDAILLESRAEKMLSAQYSKKFIKMFDGSGHALPFTNPEDCWSYLCSIIPIFARYENRG